MGYPYKAMGRVLSRLLYFYLIVYLSGLPQLAQALEENQPSLVDWGARKQEYKGFLEHLAELRERSPEEYKKCATDSGHVANTENCEKLYQAYLAQLKTSQDPRLNSFQKTPNKTIPVNPKTRQIPVRNTRESGQFLGHTLEGGGGGENTGEDDDAVTPSYSEDGDSQDLDQYLPKDALDKSAFSSTPSNAGAEEEPVKTEAGQHEGRAGSWAEYADGRRAFLSKDQSLYYLETQDAKTHEPLTITQKKQDGVITTTSRSAKQLFIRATQTDPEGVKPRKMESWTYEITNVTVNGQKMSANRLSQKEFQTFGELGQVLSVRSEDHQHKFWMTVDAEGGVERGSLESSYKEIGRMKDKQFIAERKEMGDGITAVRDANNPTAWIYSQKGQFLQRVEDPGAGLTVVKDAQGKILNVSVEREYIDKQGQAQRLGAIWDQAKKLMDLSQIANGKPPLDWSKIEQFQGYEKQILHQTGALVQFLEWVYKGNPKQLFEEEIFFDPNTKKIIVNGYSANVVKNGRQRLWSEADGDLRPTSIGVSQAVGDFDKPASPAWDVELGLNVLVRHVSRPLTDQDKDWKQAAKTLTQSDKAQWQKIMQFIGNFAVDYFRSEVESLHRAGFLGLRYVFGGAFGIEGPHTTKEKSFVLRTIKGADGKMSEQRIDVEVKTLFDGGAFVGEVMKAVGIAGQGGFNILAAGIQYGIGGVADLFGDDVANEMYERAAINIKDNALYREMYRIYADDPKNEDNPFQLTKEQRLKNIQNVGEEMATEYGNQTFLGVSGKNWGFLMQRAVSLGNAAVSMAMFMGPLKILGGMGAKGAMASHAVGLGFMADMTMSFLGATKEAVHSYNELSHRENLEKTYGLEKDESYRDKFQDDLGHSIDSGIFVMMGGKAMKGFLKGNLIAGKRLWTSIKTGGAVPARMGNLFRRLSYVHAGNPSRQKWEKEIRGRVKELQTEKLNLEKEQAKLEQEYKNADPARKSEIERRIEELQNRQHQIKTVQIPETLAELTDPFGWKKEWAQTEKVKELKNQRRDLSNKENEFNKENKQIETDIEPLARNKAELETNLEKVKDALDPAKRAEVEQKIKDLEETIRQKQIRQQEIKRELEEVQAKRQQIVEKEIPEAIAKLEEIKKQAAQESTRADQPAEMKAEPPSPEKIIEGMKEKLEKAGEIFQVKEGETPSQALERWTRETRMSQAELDLTMNQNNPAAKALRQALEARKTAAAEKLVSKMSEKDLVDAMSGENQSRIAEGKDPAPLNERGAQDYAAQEYLRRKTTADAGRIEGEAIPIPKSVLPSSSKDIVKAVENSSLGKEIQKAYEEYADGSSAFKPMPKEEFYFEYLFSVFSGKIKAGSAFTPEETAILEAAKDLFIREARKGQDISLFSDRSKLVLKKLGIDWQPSGERAWITPREMELKKIDQLEQKIKDLGVETPEFDKPRSYIKQEGRYAPSEFIRTLELKLEQILKERLTQKGMSAEKIETLSVKNSIEGTIKNLEAQLAKLDSVKIETPKPAKKAPVKEILEQDAAIEAKAKELSFENAEKAELEMVQRVAEEGPESLTKEEAALWDMMERRHQDFSALTSKQKAGLKAQIKTLRKQLPPEEQKIADLKEALEKEMAKSKELKDATELGNLKRTSKRTHDWGVKVRGKRRGATEQELTEALNQVRKKIEVEVKTAAEDARIRVEIQEKLKNSDIEIERMELEVNGKRYEYNEGAKRWRDAASKEFADEGTIRKHLEETLETEQQLHSNIQSYAEDAKLPPNTRIQYAMDYFAKSKVGLATKIEMLQEFIRTVNRSKKKHALEMRETKDGVEIFSMDSKGRESLLYRLIKKNGTFEVRGALPDGTPLYFDPVKSEWLNEAEWKAKLDHEAAQAASRAPPTQVFKEMDIVFDKGGKKGAAGVPEKDSGHVTVVKPEKMAAAEKKSEAAERIAQLEAKKKAAAEAKAQAETLKREQAKRILELETKLNELKAQTETVSQLKNNKTGRPLTPEQIIARLENEAIRILETRLKQLDAMDSVKLGRQTLKKKAIARAEYIEALESHFIEVLKLRLRDVGVEAKEIKAAQVKAAGNAKKLLKGLERLLAERLKEVLNEKRITEDVDLKLTHEGVGWAYKRLKELLGIKKSRPAKPIEPKVDLELKAEVEKILNRNEQKRARGEEPTGDVELNTIVDKIFEKAEKDKGRELSPEERADIQKRVLKQLEEPVQPAEKSVQELLKEAEVKKGAKLTTDEIAEIVRQKARGQNIDNTPPIETPKPSEADLNWRSVEGETIAPAVETAPPMEASALIKAMEAEYPVGKRVGDFVKDNPPDWRSAQEDAPSNWRYAKEHPNAGQEVPLQEVHKAIAAQADLNNQAIQYWRKSRFDPKAAKSYKNIYAITHEVRHPLRRMAKSLKDAVVKKFSDTPAKPLKTLMEKQYEKFQKEMASLGGPDVTKAEFINSMRQYLREKLTQRREQITAEPHRSNAAYRGGKNIASLADKGVTRYGTFWRMTAGLTIANTVLSMLGLGIAPLVLYPTAFGLRLVYALGKRILQRHTLNQLNGPGPRSPQDVVKNMSEQLSEIQGMRKGSDGKWAYDKNGVKEAGELVPPESLELALAMERAQQLPKLEEWVAKRWPGEDFSPIEKFNEKIDIKAEHRKMAKEMKGKFGQIKKLNEIVDNPKELQKAVKEMKEEFPQASELQIEEALKNAAERQRLQVNQNALEMAAVKKALWPELEGKPGKDLEALQKRIEELAEASDGKGMLSKAGPDELKLLEANKLLEKQGALRLNKERFERLAKEEIKRMEDMRDFLKNTGAVPVKPGFWAQHWLKALLAGLAGGSIGLMQWVMRKKDDVKQEPVKPETGTITEENPENPEKPVKATNTPPTNPQKTPQQQFFRPPASMTDNNSGGGGGQLAQSGKQEKPEKGEYGGDADFDGSGGKGGGGGGGGGGDSGGDGGGEEPPGFGAQESPSFAGNQADGLKPQVRANETPQSEPAAKEETASAGRPSRERGDSAGGGEEGGGPASQGGGLTPRQAGDASQGGGETRLGRAIPMLMPYSPSRRRSGPSRERYASLGRDLPSIKPSTPNVPQLAASEAGTPATEIFLPDPEQGPLFGGFIWPQAPSSLDDLLLFFFLVIFLSFMIARLMKKYA